MATSLVMPSAPASRIAGSGIIRLFAVFVLLQYAPIVLTLSPSPRKRIELGRLGLRIKPVAPPCRPCLLLRGGILDQSESEHHVDCSRLWRTCRSVASATVTAGALLFLLPDVVVDGVGRAAPPLPPGQPALFRFVRPQAAFAAEELGRPPIAIVGATVDDAGVPHALDDALPSPDAFGTMANPTDATALSPLKLRQRSTVVDEVWSLVKKFYIDNTYNNQNWEEARDRYEDRLGLSVDPNEAVDDQKAMKIASEMVRSLGDKYSRVLDREQYARIQKFDLIGVGATLMPNPVDKRIMVGAPPVSGSAADLSGLKIGDFIVAVNGVPTQGRTAFDIIDQISEDPNADMITFRVLTEGPNDLPGEGFARDVTMKREFQEVKNPIAYKLSESRLDGTKVGYVRISEFNSLVKPKLESALIDLEKQGANAYVLDVRGNPGGAFQSAVEIAGLFMEDRIATNVVDSNDVELPFRTAKGHVVVGKTDPLAIWVDGGSASASEVLAGALRDNCRGIVMGDKSFGKGLIQAVYGLKNGSGLVLTVAKYMTPNGTDIQGTGIQPDVAAKGVVPNKFIPGISSDTSKVDFQDVARRMGPSMCSVPTSS